ncbi:hypothetical protein LCGC14_2175520 [marine sediment metagenome]|uniref:Uncharacterized protein n=1 Tax=marine sediment metagenome TaxID=412755 RepID=A0A0F9G1H5_9ZZZZ
MKRFEIAKTYTTRSACDHNCIFSHEVLNRTKKMVIIKVHGEIVRRKIEVYNDSETIYPYGKYSMAPVLTA